MDDRRFARVRRRLEGYLSLSGERNPEQHLDSIAGDPEARRALRGFATTGASEFFRDPGQFQTLAAEILPALTEATGRFEAWSAGCSCGAEPYSLAMALEDLRSRPDYRVLGTDIDEASVARARAGGPYAPHELTNVDQERLLRYFLEEKGAYRVRPELRRRIALRVHDLLRDEFEIGFDLILCRNVAVYLSSTAKNGLIERLAAALRPGGVLFLGASETVPFPAEKGLEHIHGPFYRRPAGAPPSRDGRPADPGRRRDGSSTARPSIRDVGARAPQNLPNPHTGHPQIQPSAPAGARASDSDHRPLHRRTNHLNGGRI